MKVRRQTKCFSCEKCGTVYLHDDAHTHHCYRCPARPSEIRKRLLAQGQVYEPVSGRG